MKVLHTVPTLSRRAGGLPRAVVGLCETLEVECLLKARDAADGFEVSEKVERAYQFRPVDLIHQHGIWSPTTIATSRYALRHDIPLIISPHGMLEPWALRHHGGRKKVAQWLYQTRFLNAAAGLHASSEAEAEQFRNFGLTPPIKVVPHGVERLKVAVGEPQTGPRVALFLSRIHEKKGVDLLLEAWRQIAPDPSEWRLQISGPDESGLVEKYRASAPSGVTFTGALYGKDKEEGFSNASLFVLPSHSENFGFAIAEALQHGRPVITTTTTPWEVIASSGAGWWVNAEVSEIADALEKALATKPDRLAAMGRRGAAVIKKLHAPRGAATEMQEFYRRVFLERKLLG